MELYHHNQYIGELDNAWWEEARMEGFTSAKNAYRGDPNKAPGKEILEIDLNDVKPVLREKIFNDSEEFGTAKSRVLRILRWFLNDTPIEPVTISLEPPSSDYRYRLVTGAHRFYCSMAAGFSHVPAIIGFDINVILDERRG